MTEFGDVVLHLPVGSDRFTSDQLDAVSTGFNEAVDRVRRVLKVDHVDVYAVHAPDMTIPGWGCGGYTYSSHSVVIALDPNELASVDKVRATFVHEFHHVVRERGPGCGSSLRERVVSEGLAMLFEENVLGHASEFAHQPVTEHQLAQLAGALDERPADDGRWFFHTSDMPLWLGYTAGYRWTRAYATEHAKSASDLVNTPAATITEQIETKSD